MKPVSALSVADAAPAQPDVFDSISINNRKRISEELFEKLRDAILSGSLPSGYAFPNENELCKKLDIGRSTLREAYAPLETMNLITRTKTGTYVNDVEDTHNAMNFDVIAQYTHPINVIEYRSIMEVGMARLAAQKAQPEDVIELVTILEEMKRHKGDNEVLTELDYAFHSHIAKITRNELLIISFNSIRIIYETFVKENFRRTGLRDEFVNDHQALIDALREHDAEKAAGLMAQHLRHIEVVAREEQD